MPLPVTRFRVWLNPQDDGEPREVVADVRHVDKLSAERSMVPMGLSMELAMHLTTAWAWASLKRQGNYSGPLERFLNVDCAGLEPDEAMEAGEDVRPTSPGLTTGSPSSSP